MLLQGARQYYASRVIPAQLVTNTDEGDARLPVILL
jgi:hypothetical protein